MPEDLSLTWWLDPVLGFFAEQAGLDTEDYVSQTGGEGLAVAIEFIADLFLQTLPSKLVQAGVGAAIGSYAIWGPGVNTRLKKELIAIANHMEFRLLDPKPSDMVEIRKNIDDLFNASKLGDPGLIGNALLRSVDEITKGFEALGIPTGMMPTPETTIPALAPGPVKKLQSF